MDTTEDKELAPLTAAVRSSLQTDGSLDEIRAQLRAHVFRVCDTTLITTPTTTTTQHNQTSHPDPQSAHHVLAKQLVAQYLLTAGYKHSLSVFNIESGKLNAPPIDWSSAQNQLGLTADEELVDSDSKQLPLLTAIVKKCLQTTDK